MATKKKTTKRKTPAKASRIQERLEKELNGIVTTLEELRTRIGRTEKIKWDFSKWRSEAVHKVTESSSDVVKSATEVLERAMKISQAVTMGALEGARKALEEQTMEEEATPRRRKGRTTKSKAKTKTTTRTKSKKA